MGILVFIWMSQVIETQKIQENQIKQKTLDCSPINYSRIFFTWAIAFER
jgi:hypothetical protein